MAKTPAEFPSTTMAERAASPRPGSITALLEKVDFPNDYISKPEIPDQVEMDYYAVNYDSEIGGGWQLDLFNRDEFDKTEADLFDSVYGRNAWRKRDALPIDKSREQILKFGELKEAEELSDLYSWFGDFFLISDRLRNLIEEMDPGSLDCLETPSHDRELDEPYWVCLPRRNLEAVDISKSDVRVIHNEYERADGTPFFTQMVEVMRGAVLDPKVTKGALHFWEIDLHRWVWSRELVARAHHAGMKGVAIMRVGRPLTGDIDRDELQAIYADFAD